MRELLTFGVLTFRHFEGICKTLDSLFQQDYPRIELIISDDGSENYEEHISGIQKYVEEHRGPNIVDVRYNRIVPNGGTVNHCREFLRMAKGVYVKEIGADDTLIGTDALTKYVDFLENNPYDICFAKLRGEREDGTYVYHLASCAEDYDVLRTLTPGETLKRLFARNFLPAPAWCARKSLFEKYGYYSDVTRLIEDYPYWIHLCQKGVSFGYLDERLVGYRLNGVSSSGSYGVAFMKDMFSIYKNCIFPYDHRYGFLQPAYNMLKQMGLNTYFVKAQWAELSVCKRAWYRMKYGPFFFYIWLGNKRIESRNKTE